MAKVDVEIDLDQVVDEIKKYYYPKEVFDEAALDTWAEENGYKKDE